MHWIPVFSGGCEALQDHRRAFRHVNIVMRTMLVTGGDNVLIESWPTQITARVRVGKDARSFARGNLKCRMPEPFDLDWGGVGGGQSYNRSLNDLDFMAKSENQFRPDHCCRYHKPDDCYENCHGNYFVRVAMVVRKKSM